MYHFLTPNTRLSSYLCIPRPVLKLSLNSTELLLYALLLDRARMSQRKREWTDAEGRVFLFYPISELAAAADKAETTVKRSLQRLEELGLLYRRRQGACRSNLLYVKVPEEPAAPAPATCGKSLGKAAEKAAFDRLLQQKRQEWGITSVPMTDHIPSGEGSFCAR